jgi:Divergent InlB B-repeat domain
VQAEFGPSATVDLSVRGHGAIEPIAGKACDDGCVLTVAPAARLDLVARPDRGAHFVRWRGACSGTKPKCRLTAKPGRSATSATAIFRS